MRILLVADWAPVEGGTERIVSTLRTTFEAGGDEIRLITSSAGSRAGGTADYVAYGSRTRVGRGLTQVANPAAAWAVRRAVTAFQPDVAHVHMFMSFLSPAAVSALGRTPSVVTLHDYRAVCPLGSNLLRDGSACAHAPGAVCRRAGCISRVRRTREVPRFALLDAALRGVGRVLTDSEWMRRSLAAKGIGAEVLPPPVAAPETFRRRRAADPVFVYGGRLDAEKGVAGLVRAFAEIRRGHPSARLRLCGDGSERGRVERLAARAGLNGAVELVSGMPADWWGALEDAWAVVVPSVWHEPCGLVAVEAIVRGVPVIASDAGGLRETVADGVTGMFYPRGDETALMRCLAAVAERRALSERLPQTHVAGLAHHHDPRDRVRRLRTIFDEVTSATAA